MHSTSLTLLARLRQPNAQKEWGQFVGLYSPLLFFWARRMGLEENDAADLVQDVFVLLLKKLPEFELDAKRSFRGWLRQVTINKFLERRRAKSNQDQQLPPAAAANLPTASELEARWDAEYHSQLIQSALRVLAQEFEPASVKACWAFVVEGRSAAAVAAELNMTEGAVRAAKFRIVCRLRQLLNGLLE
jgi:RNA polymerase sigma-70 factor (ECF subfamily)